MKTVLVVDDEPKIVDVVREYLEHAGFSVRTAGDGPAALERARALAPDLIVLDLGLPGLDGLDVARQLRRSSRVPVIILTARGDEVDRIIGLELGADDYLVKPFAFEELVARLQALARRGSTSKSSEILVGDLCIDLAGRRVTRGARSIELPQREFLLLRLLALRRGEVVSRIEIEDKLYGLERFPNSNVVASTLSLLRSKLGAPLSRARSTFRTTVPLSAGSSSELHGIA